MKKMMTWVMAATLICGASTFTACTSDKDDNPAQEQAKKNRKEFIEHTRQNLKTVAENLNFSSWNSLNYFNQYINKYVILDDNFDKTLSRTFGEEIQKSMKPLPPAAVEKWGRKFLAIVNLADFDYIFTATKGGFDVTPNTEDGMIMNIIDPFHPEYAIRIGLKGSGEEYELCDYRMSNDSVAVIVRIPAHYDFTFSTMQGSEWVTDMTISSDLTVIKGENDDKDLPAEAADFKKDTWNLKGTFKTSIPGDATEMVFNVGQDPTKHKSGMTFDFTHNGRKMIGVTTELGHNHALVDLSQITSTNSIMDILLPAIAGLSIDNLQLTLLDDLVTNVKVSDCQKVMELQSAMAHARRNYADRKTIEGYVAQLNQYITGSMTCAQLKQVIPMRLATTKIGVDWWADPALNFADENGYVPMTEMLDKESLEYGINIIDHAVEPMQQSIIVVRQLVQALQKMQQAFYTSLEEK